MKPSRDLVRSAQITRWKARQQAEAAALARQRRLERDQPQLPMEGIQPVALCPSCKGLGCGQCRAEGVVATEECRRCYGVGKLASADADGLFITKRCPDCQGTGWVPMAPKGD